MNASGRDLGLDVPIEGVQLIEASAGTGKTFTLATLYSRLVIEQRLPVSAILAVTFTEAATRELRERLRKRLALAQSLAEHALATNPVEPTDPEPGQDEESRLTGILVHAAIQQEGAEALCRRLRGATEAMDLAPVHTIHGFCRRALADHALEAGQPLLERELLQNENALRREVALEFWRLHSRDGDGAATLAEIWKSPAELAASMRDLVAIDVLLPAPGASGGQTLVALQQAREALAREFVLHGADARESLRLAFASKSVNATHSKDAAVDPVWKAMAMWVTGARDSDPPTDKLANYGASLLATRTNGKKTTPQSPLFDAIDAWVVACAEHATTMREQRIAMVHAAREFACTRITAIKRERGLLGFDDMIRGVADALEGAQGDLFAQKLQAQYAVALVDEFQDTDARQWSIFQCLFATRREDDARANALFLIGDPKQAIYRFRGGDVFTYLAAAAHARARHRLQRNFRSRPLALSAVQALFELSGADAFAQDGIRFEPVQPGDRCHDGDLLRDGAVVPALNFLVLPSGEEAKESVEVSRERATAACVAQIHALLTEGLAGRTKLRDGKQGVRALQPGDIAVLVEANRDAERFQQALSLAGIPSVAAGRSSLYASEEAQHLCWLFAALLAPADDARLRAALAAPLFGLDAAALAAFDDQESTHRQWQDRLQDWQQRAQRHGPMALLGAICAAQAPRLLGLRDGERRLTNYLQLAEELQAADAHALGLGGLLSELERRIDDADQGNDAELLRLESDAERVRILTLHMSKGLEFAIVFLPYVATSGAERRAGKPDMARFHDGQRRVAMLETSKGDEACLREAAEERAERLRLLYVGLTRARLATWVAWGAANNVQRTPMGWLLHREPDAAAPLPIDAAGIDERLALLRTVAPSAISVAPAKLAGPLSRLAFGAGGEVPPAAIACRVLDRDWWVYSFSQLAREDAGADPRGAEDETEPSPSLPYSRFSGTRFGNSLHAALENVDMRKWLDWSTPMPPTGEFDALADALREHGYASEADLDEGVPLLTTLIAETLNVRLPEGARLADLPDASRLNEMEFHLAMAPTRLSAMLDLLHRHGIIVDRQGFGLRQRIEGLLTGRIDLVYEFDGRYYVVDYKSNQLRDYGHASIATAVRDSEYDLQYVLYTLALHRWLRFRIGDGYNMQQHLGGVRYLFSRGLDRNDEDGPGVHALELPNALIAELDELLQDQVA